MSQNIDNIYKDYLTSSYPDRNGFYSYFYFFNIETMAIKSSAVTPLTDYISPKPPETCLGYCIKAENMYYLTEYEIFTLRSILDMCI